MSNLGTRAHKIGSIYSRVKNMMNSGIMDPNAKPLWYDIYEAFPPKREPVFVPGPTPNKMGLVVQEDNARPLLYKEDWARASIAKLHQDFYSVYHLRDEFHENFTQIFIDTYVSLQKLHPEFSKEELFEQAEKALNIETT